MIRYVTFYSVLERFERKIRMKLNPSVTIGSIICLSAALALAGCETSPPKALSPSTSPEPATSVSMRPAASDPAASQKPNATSSRETEVQSPDKMVASSNLVQPASVTDGKKDESGKHSNKTFDAYTAQKPLLMGVALLEAKDKVEALHGKPKDQFVMDDEGGSLTVFDYDGFAIGFNTKNQVEFVDVTSADIDPGLNGLKLGQTPDEAVHALGKADTVTDYVLSFKTKTSILKLDVDPKTKTIQSIKLFARSE